jgi:hypothetical protein
MFAQIAGNAISEFLNFKIFRGRMPSDALEIVRPKASDTTLCVWLWGRQTLNCSVAPNSNTNTEKRELEAI